MLCFQLTIVQLISVKWKYCDINKKMLKLFASSFEILRGYSRLVSATKLSATMLPLHLNLVMS